MKYVKPAGIVLIICTAIGSWPLKLAAELSQISEDFGGYAANPQAALVEKLQMLGYMDESESSVKTAMDRFYRRTGLPASSDSNKQFLDVSLVESAEREAARVLDGSSTEASKAFAYTIAPWLTAPLVPLEDMPMEREALTAIISDLDGVLNEVSNTIDTLY